MQTSSFIYPLKCLIAFVIVIIFLIADTSIIIQQFQSAHDLEQVEKNIETEFNKSFNQTVLEEIKNSIRKALNDTTEPKLEEKIFNLIFKKFYKVNNTVIFE